MITLLLVDDHPIVRQGLRALLTDEPTFQILGEAADGFEAIALAAQLQPAVLVVDLMMPGVGGLEVTRRLRALSNPPQVVVFSMHGDEAYVRDVLRNGAAAYVLKKNDTAELITAIRAAAEGRRYLSPPLSDQAIASYARTSYDPNLDSFALLTAREREVLKLVAEGRSSAEVAAMLSISPRTAETHRTNLMRKLGLHSYADLLRFAEQRGIIGHH
ncbi:MAG: response regulator [Oscillochloridaceae bacterium umkhey_bin13]